MMTKKEKEFYHGFAVAVGALARDHRQPSMAVDIMNCNGVTLRMLEESGADAFDLDPIRKELGANER